MNRRRTLTEAQRSAYERHFDLGALFDFSTIINSSLDLKFILGHLLLTIMGKLLSVRGIVVLHDEGSTYVVETMRGLPAETAGESYEWKSLPAKIVYVKDARNQTWARFFRRHGIDVIAPLISQEKILGIVGFSPGGNRKLLGKTEETYVKSLANIAAGAIEKGLVVKELHHVNRRLDVKIQELRTLFEVSKEFNGILNADELVKLLLFSIMGQVGTTKYVLLMKRENAMKVIASRLLGELPEEVREYLSTVENPVVVDTLTLRRDASLKAMLLGSGVQAIIPLQIQHETRGILVLGTKLHGGAYSPTDVEFLLSLGNLAIISLENARLFNETIEKQKLEDELVIAREIQRALLPAKLPEIPGFDLAATNISSKQVGGDYYDVVALPENRFMIAVGDVSGKGTPASLLMANLQATIRALIPIGLPLGELTTRVNDLICENTTSGRFITFFWMILEANSGELSYVNAGHNLPMLFRADGTIERLFSGGIILGIIRSPQPYEEGRTQLKRGDTLLLFTDGVTEAMNLAGIELGEDLLMRLCETQASASAQEMITAIIGTVHSHSKGTPQTDDVTLVALKAI